MTRGDAHPNSNSAWGQDVDIRTWYDFDEPELVNPESIDSDRYETPAKGEIRLYLVAKLEGRKLSDGPRPPMPLLRYLYVTPDGRYAVEVESVADEVDGEAVPIDTPAHAIARDVSDLDRVEDASNAQRFRDTVMEAHL